jgi:hypothetical protein
VGFLVVGLRVVGFLVVGLRVVGFLVVGLLVIAWSSLSESSSELSGSMRRSMAPLVEVASVASTNNDNFIFVQPTINLNTGEIKTLR